MEMYLLNHLILITFIVSLLICSSTPARAKKKRNVGVDREIGASTTVATTKTTTTKKDAYLHTECHWLRALNKCTHNSVHVSDAAPDTCTHTRRRMHKVANKQFIMVFNYILLSYLIIHIHVWITLQHLLRWCTRDAQKEWREEQLSRVAAQNAQSNATWSHTIRAGQFPENREPMCDGAHAATRQSKNKSLNFHSSRDFNERRTKLHTKPTMWTLSGSTRCRVAATNGANISYLPAS